MRGQALRCRGLVEADPEILLQAVAEYRQCPHPLELAAACEDTGVHLALAKRLTEAVPLLDEAIRLYEDLGAVRDVRRVRAELRKHGVTRSGPRRRERPTTGWGSLTQTERKVAGLVAQRLSNPEVAERLFISRHTVESHLKHVYQKLSLRSRVELAAEAARHTAHDG
jgi:DNA-binding CsgD family transcriptional regulator